MLNHLPELLLSAALLSAPLQCGSESDPQLALEDSPGEALYRLAERFAASGDLEAQARTLEFLIERHPASRFAASARTDLARLRESLVAPPSAAEK